MNDVFNIEREIHSMKLTLLSIEKNRVVIGDWINKQTLMRFFDYGETQLRSLEKTNQLIVSKIGRRKFYSLKSIINLLNKNIES